MSEPSVMPGHGESCFAVLPDRAAALAVAPLMGGAKAPRLCHPSGRPWLVGRWAEGELVAAAVRGTRLVVIGDHAVDEAWLEAEAVRLRDTARLGALAGRLPGCFHLVALVDGVTRIQGPASGLRLVFHTRIRGMEIAADRADTLAALTGAQVDERQVAARLLWPMPHPLPDQCLWRGVESVPAGEALEITPGGRDHRRTRWWTPPEPVRPLAAQAESIRDVLAEAVQVRTDAGGVVSCDLSGGLDSTSITFLAAHGKARVVAGTRPGRDPGDDDLAWARLAMTHLPDVEHVVWSPEAKPFVYQDLLRIDDALDEPTIGVMDRARLVTRFPALLARGSRRHLTGIGGDHVAWSAEAHFHTLLRRKPLFALRQLRGFRALWTWPLTGMVRELADARPYRRYLRDAAGELGSARPSGVAGALGWGMPPRLFPWVTPEAHRMVRELLREAAGSAEPMAPTRGEHLDISQIRSTTRIIRQWDWACVREGLPTSHPYFDDRVIGECLAVRPEDRVSPWEYKPLLVAAMRGVVPDECLARSTKAHASLDAAEGLRRHRGDLLALWGGSRLARMGLVDAGRLRDLALRPDTPELRESVLYSTIACEIWLRTLDIRPSAVLPTAGTS
ncbi:lasso peptide isopeptide bond-forming cyclase [Streptomyces sp. ET3-23]|uniref:lasso peptide isopeptide bond-forming cyclase n=1 Tax=Streptomyces sp. ET3-23 TaxID=2885643 RepID=UPI001D10A460|nr:lasso peptide isopeptide bond-forming cyclase [Streptomyces sp. ET3-23]MCC2278750.1 lasso peptide isopeptide bond-forming cyclase [Streptomyces sp. ET3-23]